MTYAGLTVWVKDQIHEMKQNMAHLKKRVEANEQMIIQQDRDIAQIHDRLVLLQDKLRARGQDEQHL